MTLFGEKLQRTLASARVGMWEWEFATDRVVWSEQVETIFGLPPQSFQGTYEAYCALIYPEDLPELQRAIQLALESESPDSYQIEHRIRWPDGSIRWLEARGTVQRGPLGKPVRLGGTVIDVTPRKTAEAEALRATQALQNSEELLRQFIKHTPAAVAMFDTDMRYIQYAERWLIDYRIEGHDLIGKSHYDVFPDQPERWKECHQRVLAGAVERCEEDRFERADGSVEWLQWEVRPWCKADGSIGGVIMFTQVITERKRVEDALRLLHEQKRQAQKLEALGTLAGGIAHDFNNLLTAIVAFSKAAKFERPKDISLHAHLDQILNASGRATDLVRQILSFSRQQPRERKPTNLGRVVEEALTLLRATLPSTIEISQRVSSDLPEAWVDPSQMHQVVMNLATNAAHAMGGRGKLRIQLDRVELTPDEAGQHVDLHPGEYLRLVTVDTGHGMDEATRQRIFDPFFTTKAPGEGTGLGLAVVHGIVNEHGGAIEVASEAGRGATFTVYLPALRPRPAVQPRADAHEAPGSGQRVLFVDDELALCQAAKLMLTRAGYEPITCISSKEALYTFLRDPDSWAAVVTDLTMPGMTGVELAGKFHALRPHLPILLVSGHLDPRAAATLARAGIRQIIPKPFDFMDLAGAISEALGGAET
ncbi:MAG TPA: PAS domain-containing protein [Polyangiales bacterium]|nr:PAS domain-containing protein [Polyangiales bacterium]